MPLLSHEDWLLSLRGGLQKTFRVTEAAEVRELVFTMQQKTATPAPSQDAGGVWNVSVSWKAAPDQVPFTRDFQSEKEAKDVFDDLCKEAAEVEGLIRSQKMEEAATKSSALMQRFESNSSETPQGGM